jgi:hypothetical protein
MRINELLEHIQDKNHNGIDDQLEFDLSDDLLFFMHHDDDVYRRHVYPAILKYKQRTKNGLKVHQNLFSDAVNSSYTEYCKKYPLRKLPEDLPKDVHNKLCTTMCDDIKKKD